MGGMTEIQFTAQDVIDKFNWAKGLDKPRLHDFGIFGLHNLCSPPAYLRINLFSYLNNDFSDQPSAEEAEPLENPAQLEYLLGLIAEIEASLGFTKQLFASLKPDADAQDLDAIAADYHASLTSIRAALPVSDNLLSRGELSPAQLENLPLLDILGERTLYSANLTFSPRFLRSRYLLSDDNLDFLADTSRVLSKDSWGIIYGHFSHIEAIADYFGNAVVPLVWNAVEHAFNPKNDIFCRMEKPGFKKEIAVFGWPVDENAPSGEFMVKVRDNGFGIRQEVLPQLFEEGFSTKKADVIQHGIGLYSVKRFVESYGGRLWVETKLGEGSSFIFTIPYATQACEMYYQAAQG
jgi:hypothetical protein